MATDEELIAYTERATALQAAVRELVDDIMLDESLPAQSFDDPINRHNLTQQAVASMNQLEAMKAPIQRMLEEKARLAAEAAAAAEEQLPP